MLVHHDTDLLRDLSKLRAELDSECTPTADGCLLYPKHQMSVRLATHRERQSISPARVAWALAHPEDHLGPHDLAVHICLFGIWNLNTQTVCCNPQHIKKGTLDDVRLMMQVRARGLVLHWRNP